MWIIESKDKLTSPLKWKAKNKPDKICTPKKIPNKDPKFQKYLNLAGEGKSTKDPLIIFINLSLLRKEIVISLDLIYQINPLFRHLIIQLAKPQIPYILIKLQPT